MNLRHSRSLFRWHGLAAALSLTWAVTAAWHEHSENFERAHDTAFMLGQFCLENNAAGGGDAALACVARELQQQNALMEGDLQDVETTFIARLIVCAVAYALLAVAYLLIVAVTKIAGAVFHFLSRRV